MKNVGFIGLGRMGLPMAQNLLKAGFAVHVYNRDKNKASAIVKQGAKLANYPGDVLEDAEIVISMVANDKALEDIVNGPQGLSDRLKKGTVHLSMSTVSPALAKKMGEEHRAKGACFLSATVTGRPDAAAAGKLFIFLAGEKKGKEKVKPLLDVLGQRTFDLGEEAEHSNVFKLMNNFMILSAIKALGEAFAFGEKNGLPSLQAGSVFTESQFSSPIYKIYAPLVAEQKFDPAGFTLELGFKDIRLLKEAADLSTVAMPFLNILYQTMEECKEEGLGNEDWSVIASRDLKNP